MMRSAQFQLDNVQQLISELSRISRLHIFPIIIHRNYLVVKSTATSHASETSE